MAFINIFVNAKCQFSQLRSKFAIQITDFSALEQRPLGKSLYADRCLQAQYLGSRRKRRVQGLRAVQLYGVILFQNAEPKRKLCDLVLL